MANALRAQSQHNDISDQPLPAIIRTLTGLRAAISRVAGDGSVYGRQVQEILGSNTYVGKQVMMIQGVAQGLLDDAENGMLASY
ncbi:MAG TPA: hypothetical protein VF585_08055 [Chthoniobacterales bacterium]